MKSKSLEKVKVAKSKEGIFNIGPIHKNERNYCSTTCQYVQDTNFLWVFFENETKLKLPCEI